MTRSFNWHQSLATGNAGARQVKAWLLRQGYEVTSVEKDKRWQKRDIDFLVDGLHVEVKSDNHQPGALFAELTVDGKPGYLYKSRADVLVYYFPQTGVIYWVDMPRLVWWVAQQKPGLKVFQVRSNRSGSREWLAEGVVVDAEALKAIKALWEYNIGEDNAA